MKKVHLIGICGTAMAALASMLKERGWQVSGSDAAAYPPMSDLLAAQGIEVGSGYEAERLDKSLALVVVGNVAAQSNLEAVRARELGLCCRSLPETLWHVFFVICRSSSGGCRNPWQDDHVFDAGLDVGKLRGQALFYDWWRVAEFCDQLQARTRWELCFGGG